MKVILPFLILGLAAVTFFYFASPMLETAKGLEAEQAKLTLVLATATELKEKQDELISKDNNIDPADKEKLNEFLPNNVDNVRLIIDINNIAKKFGLTVRNPAVVKDEAKSTEGAPAEPSVSRAGGGDGAPSATISFSVSSSYETLKLFLTDLAKSLRLVDIETLSFTANERNIYDYQITLRTYWLKFK